MPADVARELWAAGCSTPFGITEVGIPPLHHVASANRRCSTPFGITEVGIPSTSCAGTICGVLNAFRHHRGGHMSATETQAREEWCSTPFGITEVGITGLWCSLAHVPHVLNAFRHHRGGHLTGFRGACASPGAQRLSASQRWAFPRRLRQVRRPPVLNAFRHHRGGHAGDGGADRSSASVLNAFRHHRGGHLSADG